MIVKGEYMFWEQIEFIKRRKIEKEKVDEIFKEEIAKYREIVKKIFDGDVSKVVEHNFGIESWGYYQNDYKIYYIVHFPSMAKTKFENLQIEKAHDLEINFSPIK